MKLNLYCANALALLACLVGGCKTPEPRPEDFKTDYETDALYTLQRDVYLSDNGFKWKPTVDDPRYFFSERKAGVRDFKIAAGTAIQFKKIIYQYNFEIGAMFLPVGIILNGPYAGIAADMEFISQYSPVDLRPAYGKYINPQFLKPKTN